MAERDGAAGGDTDGPGGPGRGGVSDQCAGDAELRVLDGEGNRGVVQLRGAADGAAAGVVRDFTGDLPVAGAVGAGGGKEVSGISGDAPARDWIFNIY